MTAIGKAALPMFIKFEFCDRLMSSFVCHKFEFCGIVGCGWGAGKLTCEERCCMIFFFELKVLHDGLGARYPVSTFVHVSMTCCGCEESPTG